MEIFTHISDQTLDTVDIKIDDRAAATVVLAAGGYPEKYEKGKLIKGLDQVKDSIIFHLFRLAEIGLLQLLIKILSSIIVIIWHGHSLSIS